MRDATPPVQLATGPGADWAASPLRHHASPAGERRYRAIGTTPEGREAFIVFTMRTDGRKTRSRSIGARYLHKQGVTAYEKTYPGV